MSPIDEAQANDVRGQLPNDRARPLLGPFELLERDAERAAIDALIAATPGGGRIVVIEGPFGIGKTSLIADAKSRAREAGLLVLSARGSELERTFSYGVVRQLFEPHLAGLPSEERAELLTGAAALASPLFEPVRLGAEPATDASLRLLHGLYWLTVNVSARRPLLLAVDDLHWCDLPSLRWLAYLLPRMEGVAVLVLVGVRAGEPGEDRRALAQIVSDPLATVVRPAPLGGGAVGRLLGDALSRADHAFVAACHEQTGGNPQLVRDFVHAIAAENLAPVAANLPRLRELGARAGSRALGVRLARLPSAATKLAEAVAIMGDDADLRLAGALARLDEDQASAAAGDLVRADVLRLQPAPAFVHPVIRAAVYETLTAVERERAHSRAVGLLADAGAEPERIAAHLLRVRPAADPGAVRTLRAAARSALGRGAPESAVAYLRRALDEPPPDPERVELLLELGSTETLVSGPASVEHLREAHELIDDPARRAGAAFLLGRQLFLLHHPHESHAVLQRAIEELGANDGELTRRLEAALIHNAMMEPDLYERAVERLERVRPATPGTTAGEKMLLGLLAYHDARANVPAAVAVGYARRALADGVLAQATKGGGPFVMSAVVLAMADLDEVGQVYDEALTEAHRRGSVFGFASAKVFRTQAFLYRGELHEAEQDGREALDAWDSWHLDLAAGWLTGFLGDALVELGKLEDARAVLARGGFEDDPDSAHTHWFLGSRARLRMAEGDYRRGLQETLAAGRSFEAVGGRNPAFMPWRSQAALALLQLGEAEEARRLAFDELSLARTWGAPRALGAALRVAGLAQGSDGLRLLREAVDVLEGSPARLEHAKARTELGAALRRRGQRSEAREHLRRAVELATICGARPLASRAETELLATGARPRRVALSGPGSLTPSERRVAAMAAEGLTNREIAQTLFVTPKTVEVHLSSVYRKLAIGSRTQLPAALAGPDAGR